MRTCNTTTTYLADIDLIAGAFLPKTEAGTMVGKLFKATVPAASLIVSFKNFLRLLDGFKCSIDLFLKKGSMHSIAMNTLNACSTTKKIIQVLHPTEEHSDLHRVSNVLIDTSVCIT
jgi:hypothetical protein